MLKESIRQYLVTLRNQDVNIDVSIEGSDILGLRVQEGKVVSTKAVHALTPYARIFCPNKVLAEEITQQLLSFDNMVVQEVQKDVFGKYAGKREQIPLELAKEDLKEMATELDHLVKNALPSLAPPTQFSVSLEQRTLSSTVLSPRGEEASFSIPMLQGTIEVLEHEYIFTVPLIPSDQALEASSQDVSPKPLLWDAASRKLTEVIRDIKIHQLPEGSLPSHIQGAVLSGYAMDQILITGWKLFTASKMAEKTTPYQDLLGKQAAASIVDLTDFPVLPLSLHEAGYGKAVDGEGTLTKCTRILEKGRLNTALTTRESAKRLGVEDNGHAGRTPGLVRGILPVETPANLCLLPGEASFEELLSDPAAQVFVYDVFDQFHGLDTASGDFEFPCRLAVIEKGVLKEKVTKAVITGNLKDLLFGMKKSGRDLTLLPLVITETYTVSSPDVLATGLKFR